MTKKRHHTDECRMVFIWKSPRWVTLLYKRDCPRLSASLLECCLKNNEDKHKWGNLSFVIGCYLVLRYHIQKIVQIFL